MDWTIVAGRPVYLQLIEQLASHPAGASLQRLAQETGLAKSTVHRLLASLVSLGYAAQEPETGRYRLTLKMFELSSGIVNSMEIMDVAKAHLERLSQRTGEAVHLVIRDARDIVYIYKTESGPMRMSSRVGLRSPLYCTGVGKAILATLPPEEVEDVWNHSSLKKLTSRTVVDLTEMQDQLAEVRANGYAIDEVSGGGSQISSLSVTGGSFRAALGSIRLAPGANASVSGGSFSHEVPAEYCATGFVCDGENGSYDIVRADSIVEAQIGDTTYKTLAEAIAAAKDGDTVVLLRSVSVDGEGIVVSGKAITLDLNGKTLNGGQEKGKPALTVTNRVYVMDSSEAQTGTIMREDTAENSGVSSHYVIDVQDSGWLFFQSGNVKNDSGAGGTKGASLVRVGDDSKSAMPGLTISGGTFTQDNFIVLKCDHGNLYVKGGIINSANSYAIQNWKNATIKDNAVINGNVSTWTYDGGGSDLQIQGGTVNGDIESVTYDGVEGKPAKVSITGGTVNGTLNTVDYSTGTTSNDPTKATIEVTGGTFSTDPSRYLIEGSAGYPER